MMSIQLGAKKKKKILQDTRILKSLLGIQKNIMIKDAGSGHKKLCVNSGRCLAPTNAPGLSLLNYKKGIIVVSTL